MVEQIKKPVGTVETIGLKFDGENISYGKVTEYQLVEQYTVKTAGVLGFLPKEYKIFRGRQFQWNENSKQYDYFAGAVIVEFSVENQKFYVNGENFYDALEKAVLMKNYILHDNKKQKE